MYGLIIAYAFGRCIGGKLRSDEIADALRHRSGNPVSQKNPPLTHFSQWMGGGYFGAQTQNTLCNGK
jgi:hypothetical protein